MKELLPKLTERLAYCHANASKLEVIPFTSHVPQEDNDIISHTWFWPRVGQFFKPKDVIVTETGGCFENKGLLTLAHALRQGTSNFGIMDVRLPEKSILVSQILWGSIGWSVGMLSTTRFFQMTPTFHAYPGSTLGAALAARDVGLGRTILFVGDGSLYAYSPFIIAFKMMA